MAPWPRLEVAWLEQGAGNSFGWWGVSYPVTLRDSDEISGSQEPWPLIGESDHPTLTLLEI